MVIKRGERADIGRRVMTGLLLLVIGMGLSGCSQGRLREAQGVVAHADSLRTEGPLYSDSAALAQAYSTLERWQWWYADAYAHVCYHYGRLLREREDPVKAMQVFLSAAHSRTHGYHILGRVYSNMGSISHLAEEYSLSYDMYEKSADCFLRDGDSLLYYYGLNNMAFELAQQGKKEGAMTLLMVLEKNCTDKHVLTKSLETKAVAHLYTQQFDSAVFYAKRMIGEGDHAPTGYLVCAQAYSYAGNKDSAICYARHVLQVSQNLFHQNNALYILTNDAPDDEDVRIVAAERADTQKLIETRHGKLTQAVQLLSQDLTRRPNIAWVYAIIGTILIASFAFSILWKRRKNQMHKQITSIADQQANSMIASIKQHIDTDDINSTLHWKNYTAMKKDADLYLGGIVTKLEAQHLNEVEIRFCILTLLNYRLRTIAKTINYSYPSAIKTLKKRISDKLGTTPPELKNFLLHLLPTS